MPKPCAVPMCAGWAEVRGRCRAHATLYEQARGTHSQRGYTYAWEKIRRTYLATHPACEVCGQPAREVDHIVPLVLGGTHDFDNLRALCKVDHSRRTARDVWPKKKI
jgi:5-methylcytosine-specific restriction protein A